jgi:undecaprenyl diphosphate synthase
MRSLDNEKLPRHVAIIMDGNGRWAKARNLPRVEGHIIGIESVRDIVTTTRELGIPYLTLYAFPRKIGFDPRTRLESLWSSSGFILIKSFLLCLKKVYGSK